MAKKKVAKKRGRPRGSKSKTVESVIVEPSKCTKCGSSRRSNYLNKRTLDLNGLRPDGTVYTSVTWRRTKCLDCGQMRDDKTYNDTQHTFFGLCICRPGFSFVPFTWAVF